MPNLTVDTDLGTGEGVDGAVFEGIKAAIVEDRYAYFGDFFDNFYNTAALLDFLAR
jgi:hypothetical protein